MATSTIKKGGRSNGTSSQKPSTQRTQEVGKQETQSTSLKPKALKCDVLGQWKAGELFYYDRLYGGVIVAINSVIWNNGFPLAYVTLMDDRYYGQVTIPLKDLKEING